MVYFTLKAENAYLTILDYLSDEFGELVANEFTIKVNKFVEFLPHFPKIGTIENTAKQIYGFQLTKHNRVFYRVRDEKIILLDFFDVRQKR